MEKKMKDKLYLRKIILCTAIVILALIYIFQVISGSRSSVKDFKIEKAFDTIEFSSADKGKVELKRYGDFWKIGMDDVDADKVNLIVEAVKNIRTLGLVSKSSGDDATERYGLTDAQKVSVKVSDNGKEYLSLEIGKDAANGQQNYIRVNGSKDIYLASGALKGKFSYKAEELIKKVEEAPKTEGAAEASPEGGTPTVSDSSQAPEGSAKAVSDSSQK